MNSFSIGDKNKHCGGGRVTMGRSLNTLS